VYDRKRIVYAVGMPVNNPAQPRNRADQRKLDLLLERSPRGSVLHDAWLLQPAHDDHLYADPLETLRLVNRLRARADELEVAALAVARSARFTWAQIGEPYGLSKQAAFNRLHQIGAERLPLD
jgi:hypothetical protein